MARKYGVEELLPPGKKSAEYKEARSKEVALKIKGTGPKKVKGHKWERTLATRLEERRKAMLEMPALIRLWKQVSIVSQKILMSYWDKEVFWDAANASL